MSVQENHRPGTAASQANANPDSVVSKRLPFGQFPHAIAADPRLKPAVKLTIMALLYWARDKDRCTVSDRQLAGYLNVSRDTVQRNLRAIEEAGHIRCEEAPVTPQNATGRVIFL